MNVLPAVINIKTKIPWLVENSKSMSYRNKNNKHNINVSSNPSWGEKVAITTEILQCMKFYLSVLMNFQNQNFIVNGK